MSLDVRNTFNINQYYICGGVYVGVCVGVGGWRVCVFFFIIILIFVLK